MWQNWCSTSRIKSFTSRRQVAVFQKSETYVSGRIYTKSRSKQEIMFNTRYMWFDRRRGAMSELKEQKGRYHSIETDEDTSTRKRAPASQVNVRQSRMYGKGIRFVQARPRAAVRIVVPSSIQR